VGADRFFLLSLRIQKKSNMRIKEILQAIEQIAPLSLQEDFDNSGVQVGDIIEKLPEFCSASTLPKM
jgi:hypothetical protein